MSLEFEKKDVDLQMLATRAAYKAEYVGETTETDRTINGLIREKYSLSQEVCLHRKKMMGTVGDEEWTEYCNFVEDCIKKAEEQEKPEKLDTLFKHDDDDDDESLIDLET